MANNLFILFAHARSGSTVLNKILNTHPEIKSISEPFNHDRHQWDDKTYYSRIHDIPSFDTVLDEIASAYNGMNHHFSQLDFEYNKHLLLNRASRVIFLWRKNLLQAVISRSIAEQTKVWHAAKTSSSSSPAVPQTLDPLDLKRVKRRLEKLEKGIRSYRDLLKESGKDFFEICYEDFLNPRLEFLDKLKQLDPIFTYLGNSPISTNTTKIAAIESILNPTHRKLNSEASYRRIPNIDEVEAQLGCEATGYLFNR